MIIRDESIMSGISESPSIGHRGQYMDSAGIDPDMPAVDVAPATDFLKTSKKPFGGIRPISYDSIYVSSASAGECTFMVTCPKDAHLYMANTNGDVYTLKPDLTAGPDLGVLGGRDGLAYYNNNIFIASGIDIDRYSYMDEDFADRRVQTDFWNTELGFANLEYTVYPTIHGVKMPCHFMHRHLPKNALYVCDVQDGNGCLHKIRMKEGVDSFDGDTHEGAVDDDSEFKALDFPKGVYPTCIESMGSYLIIGLIEMGEDGDSNDIFEQKPAKLAMWDCDSDTYQDVTPDDFSDPLITAIKNVNGTIYVFSGSTTGGCRVSQMLGVGKLAPVHFLANAYPPLCGAVDKSMDRVTFGTGLVTGQTVTAQKGICYSIGSTFASFNSGLHGTVPPDYIKSLAYTAIKYFQPGLLKNQPIAAEVDSLGNTQLTRYSAKTVNDISIRIILDDGSDFVDVNEIGGALFDDERTIKVYPDDAIGEVNFCIELIFGNGARWKSSMKQIGSPFQLDSITLSFANKLDPAGFLPVINLPITYEVTKRNV